MTSSNDENFKEFLRNKAQKKSDINPPPHPLNYSSEVKLAIDPFPINLHFFW